MERQTKLEVLQNELSRKEFTQGRGWDMSCKVILSDVLVWLIQNKVKHEINNHRKTSKKLCKLITIFSYDYHIMYELYRDLTKPYLSEQSDEVISGLYEVFLLTKKD